MSCRTWFGHIVRQSTIWWWWWWRRLFVSKTHVHVILDQYEQVNIPGQRSDRSRHLSKLLLIWAGMKVTAQCCLNSCILSAVLCFSVKECFGLCNGTCHHHLSMKHCSSYVRYKTLTVVTVMITVFCNVMLHSLVTRYPLYICWCTHTEVHFHGALWADLTWGSYSTLAYNMGLLKCDGVPLGE